DCDTTGIEPAYSLLRNKHLSGGGRLKMFSQSLPSALAALGYDAGTIEAMLNFVTEHGTLIGHPLLKQEHQQVFHCASDPTDNKDVVIQPTGHISMMAAVQPFISGAISKTVNLPATASVKDVSDCFMSAWTHGLKSMAIYREGCKLFQPLQAVRGENPLDETAPHCAECGFVTIRVGSCFRCPNCGATIGCS
ncbi:MAG: hypothetical protein ACKO7B_03735, partial [Flavobacteriales bacterium]